MLLLAGCANLRPIKIKIKRSEASKKSFGYNFNYNLARPFTPLRPALIPLTCLLTVGNLKRTNPYMLFIGVEINQKDLR